MNCATEKEPPREIGPNGELAPAAGAGYLLSIATVEAMVEAGQLLTVLPAGAKYPRVTGASMLAFAGRVPDEPPSIPQMDVRGLLERKRGPSEAALAPLFSGDWS